jgi:acyl dehydratase
MSGLISDEARTWIGRDYGSRTISVGRNDIARFAIAMGIDDPVHFDAGAARDAGHRDVLAPPNFVSALGAMSQLFVPRSQLRDDGLVGEQYPPLPVKRVLVGEIELLFHHEICAGDEITVSKKLVDMREREGRDGTPMVMIDIERRYTDQAGDLVAEERYSVIVR